MTAAEFKNAVREGKPPAFKDADLVTCATCAVISGISAVMTIPAVAGADYRDCTSLSLNGIECSPVKVNDDGSAEVTVEAAAVSPDRTSETIPKNYCTGDLLRDIAEGKEIEISVGGKDGVVEDIIFPEDIISARISACIGAGENGCALVNGGENPLKNGHLFQPLGADFSEAFVYGCGEISPFVNDPDLRSMGAGTKILVNGVIGTITAINNGVESEGVFAGVKVGGPSLSVSADMKDMMPEFMGGLTSKSGRESVIAVAVAIPVLDSESIKALSVTDKEIPLPVIDLDKSVKVGDADYGAVWQDADRSIEVNPLNCLYCGGCPAGSLCPRKAVILGGGVIQSRCISCGRCLNTCPGEVYSMNTGSITIKEGCKEGITEGITEGMSIPIKLRLSDRRRAEEICEIMKEMIEDGEFSLTEN
ncbi:MAG: methanogenesis marker 16 metalloprotein [Methanomicrobium sp.]|nr:methanogenesis marker 16 metalloprotein [Methanomicrobium sp.]